DDANAALLESELARRARQQRNSRGGGGAAVAEDEERAVEARYAASNALLLRLAMERGRVVPDDGDADGV
ncbi:hypothetical protein HK405_013461, partial [Cladochytrium tenue]